MVMYLVYRTKFVWQKNYIVFFFFFSSLIQCIKLYVISINNIFFPFSDPRDPEVMLKYRTQMCKNGKSAKLE